MTPLATRSGSLPGGGVRVTAALVLPTVLFLVSVSFARASDVTGYVELGGSTSSTHAEFPAAPDVKLDSSAWFRRVNVTWTRRLFPNLRIDLGAFYERNDSTIEQDGFEQESAVSRLRPFARIALRNDFWIAEAGWYRNDEKFRTENLATFQLVRDTFIGVLGWYPSRLPLWRLEMSHVEDRDASRQYVDRTQDIVRLNSEYIPVPSTRIFYRGLLEQDLDGVRESDTETTAHTGEVQFNDTFFDSVWELYGSWNGGTRKVQIKAGGTGEILIPVVPVSGGFDLDDTPDQGVLGPLPDLVDQNTLVGTSINLGLPPPAGDRRLRNFGVDLGIVRDVNLARVWIDRDLPVEIARSFTWEIWTSDDAQFWNRRSTVAVAPFGPFDNRFEIRFPFVNTRYFKIVVAPLAGTVPSASTYPTILVTELETFLAQATGSTPRTVSTTRNLIQANSRVRILRRTALYYETSLYLAATSGSATYWAVTNGLSLQQRFDDVWSVSARATRDDGRDGGGTRVAYFYSALVNATPLETLRHSLSFSGSNTDTAGIRQSSAGVYLNTTAAVYQGVDFNFSVGTSHNAATNAASTDSIQYQLGTTLVPHRTVTININLADRDSTFSARGVPDRQEGIRAEQADVAFSPVPSVYFFASRRLEQRTLEPNRAFDTFAFSWTPFPAGALRLGLNYTENRDSLYDERDQTITPNLRWDFNRRSYVQINYEHLSTESDLGRSLQKTLAGILHIGF